MSNYFKNQRHLNNEIMVKIVVAMEEVNDRISVTEQLKNKRKLQMLLKYIYCSDQ